MFLDFSWVAEPTAWGGLGTLILLEVVLGIDNLVFISILSSRLPEDKRRHAFTIGLSLALIMRLGLLSTVAWLIGLTKPWFSLFGYSFTARDIILLIGGLLFVFYESSISLSLGLASTDASSVEVSLVNYLWPTMMVLLSAGVSHRKHAVVKVLPGAIVATAGVVLAVGGNSGLDWHAAVQHIAANPLPYALAFVGALAWSVYAVFTPAMSHGVDGTSLFFPCVAVALWIIHFASGQGWPAEPPSLVAWLFVLIAAAAIGGGYACWGYGILHGSMERLAIASYATPVLSTGASAVLLGLALSLPFWCGALLVAVGSVLNYLVSARK